MGFLSWGWRWRWRRRRSPSTARVSPFLCASFCLLSLCALLSATVDAEPDDSGSGGRGSTVQEVPAPEETRWVSARRRCWSTAAAAAEAWRRRYLVGPGSYPPRCVSKCAGCSPCEPVHVPVPPGTPVIAEYYPEAWRCTCGGKLYTP